MIVDRIFWLSKIFLIVSTLSVNADVCDVIVERWSAIQGEEAQILLDNPGTVAGLALCFGGSSGGATPEEKLGILVACGATVCIFAGQGCPDVLTRLITIERQRVGLQNLSKQNSCDIRLE